MKLDLAKTNGSSPPSTTTRTKVKKDSTAGAAPALTTATHPTPPDIAAAALEEPAIKEAIQRGTRKVRVKKYAAVTKSGRVLETGYPQKLAVHPRARSRDNLERWHGWFDAAIIKFTMTKGWVIVWAAAATPKLIERRRRLRGLCVRYAGVPHGGRLPLLLPRPRIST